MIKKVFFWMISMAFLLHSCGEDGWSDDRKEKIKSKCNEELYDCECYLELTMETFKDPEDYNKKAEKDLEYQKQIKEKCDKRASGAKDGDVWADEDFAPLYENCNTDEYDCDCAIGKIIESYPGKVSFGDAMSKDVNLLTKLFEDCRIEN